MCETVTSKVSQITLNFKKGWFNIIYNINEFKDYYWYNYKIKL